MEALVASTNQQTLPKITYPDLPVSDKIEQLWNIIFRNFLVN
ncbi:ATP-dependent helicase HrpA [Francisella sp. MA067296]|nr:ATP-dependent helicase HrpA [Francisella sp. MA067296]